jgi:hypothetical protein
VYETLRIATSPKPAWKIAASATPPPRSGDSLAWTIEYDEGAVEDLKKLDNQARREIVDFMEKRVGRRTRALLANRFPTANSACGVIACATIASSARFNKPSLLSSSCPSATAALSMTTNQKLCG